MGVIGEGITPALVQDLKQVIRAGCAEMRTAVTTDARPLTLSARDIAPLGASAAAKAEHAARQIIPWTNDSRCAARAAYTAWLLDSAAGPSGAARGAADAWRGAVAIVSGPFRSAQHLPAASSWKYHALPVYRSAPGIGIEGLMAIDPLIAPSGRPMTLARALERLGADPTSVRFHAPLAPWDGVTRDERVVDGIEVRLIDTLDQISHAGRIPPDVYSATHFAHVPTVRPADRTPYLMNGEILADNSDQHTLF